MSEFLYYINKIATIKEDALEELQKCFKTMQLPKDAFFVQEGEYAQQIGFLKKGIVRAYFLNQEGKEYNKQFL